MSATSRCGAGMGGGQGSPGSNRSHPCCSGVHPGLLPAALQDREALGLITTHLHPVWVQLVQAATRAGSVVDLKLIPLTVDAALIAPRAPELGGLLFQPVPPTVCSCFSVR